MFEAANCLRERFIAEECMSTSVASITALQQQGPVHPEQDPIIGPGKAIDTNTFFVLSSDTLVSLNARDPQVITTGPDAKNSSAAFF
jgi:homoserine acetyltransferase